MESFNKKFLIFGGSGALGKTLTKRLLELNHSVVVFSRDEAKQHKMRQEFEDDDVEYIIGDIRDYDSVSRAVLKTQAEVIINAAAMKQVPACEFYPYEAVLTNTIGTRNLVKAIENAPILHVCTKVLSISTDKACKPVNSYGMTKALQERIHLNGEDNRAVFNCVRYGNVLESTGSVIPVFKKRLQEGKGLKITHKDMTRFLLSLDQAVDLIFTALEDNVGGKIFIPKVPAAKITDLANILRMHYAKKMAVEMKDRFTGIRPGEKLDEILVSEEELMRTEDLGDVFVIHDIKSGWRFEDLKEEYSSKSDLMNYQELKKFLEQHGVLSE